MISIILVVITAIFRAPGSSWGDFTASWLRTQILKPDACILIPLYFFLAV